jgi:tRNA nucleotidyltransferase (CCA-adding enzyme)
MQRLDPPATVLAIASQLERAGYETWCVGGAIRDALLGHPHLDWDLATSATPDQMRSVFGAKRTIPVGAEFGTVGVLDSEGTMHEVTTFRRDVNTDGRHAVVEFGASLDDDLARRDFTINAMAYSPSRMELRDPFGGQGDIERRLVRAVGDPEARMREDRLRALRAIRFAARFGFAIDDATRQAIDSSAPYLGRLSRERVKQELDKTLEQVRRPSVALEVWRSSGAFASLLPQLTDLDSSALRAPDCLPMPGKASRPARRSLRFAALLASLTTKNATAVMSSLKASKVEIQFVETHVDKWRRYGGEIRRALAAGAPSDGEVRTWVAGIGRLDVGSFMRLASALWAVARDEQRDAPPVAAVRTLYRRMRTSALRDPLDIGALAIDGDDLRRAGIPAGRSLGMILRALLDIVIADPTKNSADFLLNEAQRRHELLDDNAPAPRDSQET